MLHGTNSLGKTRFDHFLGKYAELGRKIYNLRKLVVEDQHKS